MSLPTNIFPAVLISILSGGLPQGLVAAPTIDEAAVLNAIADDYYDAVLERSPELSYFAGIEIDRHDGLIDNSLNALAVWHKKENLMLAAIAGIDPAVLEGRSERITLAVLRQALESAVGLRICRNELWSVNQMSGWQLRYTRVAEMQPVGTDELREQALARWAKFPVFVSNEIENLKTGLEQGYSAPKGNTRLVVDQLDNLLAVPMEQSPFMSPASRDEDEDFKAALAAVVEDRVLPAIHDYRTYLQDEYLPGARDELGVSALPDGRECYRASLRSYTTLDRAPEEVYELGQQTVAANRTRVVELGKELYGLDDFEAIIARVAEDPANRFDTKEEVLEFSRALVERSKGAMAEWFGIQPAREMVVEPYPDYQDGTGVSSRYERPRGEEPGVYRITLYDPSEQKQGGAEITAVHEGYPGHHHQISIAIDLKGLHKINQMIFNSGYVEGWARYAEALAEEIGLYETQTALITRRAWPARGMVVDPGIHVMGWTREQAVEFMKESGRFTADRAEKGVDRIAILPGQLTAYDSGAIEMFSLRRQAEEQLGDAFDIREFHDRLLENGSVPLWMMREHVERWIAATAAIK